MRKILFLLISLTTVQVMSQEEKLRVTFNVGNPLELNVRDIKEMSFLEEQETLNIVGEWFYFDEESNTFESLDFHEDGTVTYYLYYMSLNSSDTMRGTYEYENGMLTLILSGTQYIYPITSYSENFFMRTSGSGNFRHYKVLKSFNMNTLDEPLAVCDSGDSIVFIDNVVLGLENGKVKALQKGAGYVLVKDAKLNTIVACRVNVEYKAGEVIDWSKYFKRTKDEIIMEFGAPDVAQSTDYMDMITYTNGYNAEISQLTFCIDKGTGLVYMVQPVFRGDEELRTYYDVINDKYILQEDSGSSTEKHYYDTDDILTASIYIIIHTAYPLYINYMEMVQ